ncbi:protein IQ-DOMAIN 3-like isoform X3 [Malus domestica]|uniref:protein IQ-DOMAIN 3-like isoform X3 n=1 Tax=Malus domestica TaxID=3750 RepID=UPI003975D9E5
MGRKGSWFSALKKALTPDPKEKKDQKTHKSKKRWFGKYKNEDAVSSWAETAFIIPASAPAPASALAPAPPPPPTPPPKEDVKLAEAENAQNKHVYSVALATAAAAEAAVAAAQAAAEVVRLTAVPMPRYPGKSMQEVAAIKIQTAFRGHMARRALRALRGLVRLKSLLQGQSVKRQATTTLRCMQTLARVQSEIRARRIRMSEENQAFQRQLQQKQEKELEKIKKDSMGEDWDDSIQSKEQVEAKLQMKQEAAMRRERALAYSFSHQMNSSNPAHPTFMDPSNPRWGWSWLERWMAARPWESRSTADFNDRASMRSAASRASMPVGEITKAYALRDKPSPRTPTALRSSRPASRQSPSTPFSRAPSSASVTGRTPRGNGWGGDEDSRSTLSIQSERFNRRHSITGSSVRDDESLASSPSVPSYMTPTKSTKARSRLATPSSNQSEKNGTPSEMGSVTSAKKRLSFSASPAGPRRHSGPPRVDSSSIKGPPVHERKGSR